MPKPTDLKKVLNSIEVVVKDDEAMIKIDEPDKVYISPENANDAILVGEYLKAAAREADHINATIQLNKLNREKKNNAK